MKYKINYVLPAVFKSGGVRIIFEYANLLAKRGHSVCIYYPIFPFDSYKGVFSGNKFHEYYSMTAHHFSNIIKKNFYNYCFQLKIVPSISNFFLRNADFTIATTWHTAYAVEKLNVKKGKKIYFIQDYENWRANEELVDKSYSLNLNRITSCQYLRKFLLEKFNTDSHVIYYGVDFKLFYPEKVRKFDELKTVLFIDHGDERKNVPALIKIIKKLKNDFPDLNFNCFGFKKINEMPEYVTFFENPSGDKIRELYNEADIFLYPSLHEGFGLPPIEAIACKCPVISTDVGAIPEFIVSGETGFVISRYNLDEIPPIISTLKDNPGQLKLITEKAYDTIKKNFEWDEKIDEFVNYLNRI